MKPLADARGSGRGRSGGSRGPVRAFTLVEMLVVISMIAILCAVLVPFLAQAVEQAYSTICQGNLEKLGQALRTHGARNANAMPPVTAWIGAASSAGGGPVLKCPKGYFTGGDQAGAGTKPNVKLIDPPMSVVFNTPEIEDNKVIHAFVERSNFELPGNVTVDLHEPGSYSKDWSSSRKTIPAGTIVNCLFLHYDSIGSSGAQTVGEINFETEILGVIVEDDTLNETDSMLGAPGTTYETGRKARGFENNAEIVALSNDMKSFIIERWKISFPGEEVRLLTRPMGEASYAMNNQVATKRSRMEQVLLVEYNKPVADVDGRGRDDDLEVMLAPRHFDKANMLRVNGSVRLMSPEDLDPNQGLWQRSVR